MQYKQTHRELDQQQHKTHTITTKTSATLIASGNYPCHMRKSISRGECTIRYTCSSHFCCLSVISLGMNCTILMPHIPPVSVGNMEYSFLMCDISCRLWDIGPVVDYAYSLHCSKIVAHAIMHALYTILLIFATGQAMYSYSFVRPNHCLH